MSNDEEVVARALIIEVYGVSDPDAYAKRELRVRRGNPAPGETETTPATVKFVRRRQQLLEAPKKESETLKIGTSNRYVPRKGGPPPLVW
jgi:hypothetical protein